MLRKQRRQGQWRERLRWGAQTPMTRLRGAGNTLREVSFFRHAGDGLALRPPAKAFTPLTLMPSIILGLLGLILILCQPGQAQTSAPTMTVSGPPDVLAIVYQQPGGADQVDITYARTVPHTQALRDYQALTQAAGWPVSTHSITDAAAPMHSHSGPMTSIVFQALGVVQDATHTFPIQTFAQAFHSYKRINVLFFVGPQFQFQGPRSYADPNIRMTLDQRGATYVYAVEILHPNFGSLPLSQAQTNTQASRRGLTTGLAIFGIILFIALLAGLVVYWLTSLLTPQEKQKNRSEAMPADSTEGQQEVTTKR